MEWDSKSFAWNGVNKLEIQDNTYHHHPNHHQLGSLTGSNDSGITNMFSVDLKLGRLGDVSMEKSLKQAIPQFNMSSSSSSSSSSPILALSKRGRPRNSGAQNNVFCSVDGCTSDLHQGREYHRRHKVCERHSKTPVVLVGGKEQRFCQQCSRFHSLEEFDEVKRSCRKRLDGHNRRRRKRQPEAFYTPNTAGGFISSHTGEGMLQFCCPQINTTNWATTLSQPDMYFRNIQDPIYQPLLNSISATANRRGSLKIPPENNSNCALSLLSRYTPQPSDICVGPNLQTSTMSLSAAQISSTELNLNSLVQVSLSQGLEYIQNSGSISENTSANAHSFGVFNSSTHDEFHENGSSSRIFPFGWE